MKKQKINKIGGWLILIIAIFILSALLSAYLLLHRLIWIFTLNVGIGVYISMFFLLVYSVLIWYSIYLILRKKRKAVNMSIIAMSAGLIFILWFFLIGQLIFTNYDKVLIWIYGIIYLVSNLVLAILISVYLKISKRVKKTFVK